MVRRRLRPVGPLFGVHGQTLVHGLHGALDVGGGDGECACGKLAVGSSAHGEDQHAVAGVDDGAFLGYEVHAVNHRVYQKHIVQLHAGDGLGVVVLKVGADGRPVFGTVGSVYLVDNLAYFFHVTLVLAYVGAGRDEEGEEDYPAF